MTDSEINIAIAEECGWKRGTESVVPFRPIWTRENQIACECDLPNYCHDLNAMGQVESTLNPGEQVKMEQALLKTHYWPIWRATARQRAEAFLRVKGLWKEGA